MNYNVIVYCRKHGAIGIFYDHSFAVTGPENLNAEGIRDAWFEQYGAKWELWTIRTINGIKYLDFEPVGN